MLGLLIAFTFFETTYAAELKCRDGAHDYQPIKSCSEIKDMVNCDKYAEIIDFQSPMTGRACAVFTDSELKPYCRSDFRAVVCY